MAEVAIATVVQKLGNLLVSQLFERISLLYGVRDEVVWIQRELKRMQCFLKDADAKEKDDERVKNWVEEVREVARSAEDVIDTFILEMEEHNSRRGGFVGALKKIMFFFKLKTRHEVGKKIQEIKLKINEIFESRSTYGIENIGSGGASTSRARESLKEWRRSSPRIEEPDFVGFKKDIETLEARLLEQETHRCVISIVGMGGLGKTTLVKKLFNSNKVRKNFNCHAWVYASQEYKVIDLLREISKKIGLYGEGLKELNTEELQEKIYEFLKRTKYLVVIDDIWKTETWDQLKAALPNGMSGSKIILTTRNSNVAIHADASSPVHELGFLGDEAGWELFLKKVFPKEVDVTRCASELLTLGRDIVAKCGGLPLAIVVMGGLLLRKPKTARAWLTVLLSMNWQLAQDENRCSKILALSYDDLPDYLKSCFLYFGLYPEDYEILTSKLIHLWVAEGFVQPRGQETLEDAAEDCLDELIRRSLIQTVTWRYDGRIKSCRIHDLLRDLSISKAKEGNLLDIYEKEGDAFSSRARRVAFHCRLMSPNYCDRHIRTLLCFQQTTVVGLKILCKVFKLLVVLDLPGLCSDLPDEIGELFNLKYLGLSGAAELRLPSTICKLHNLQTLDGRSSILEIPAVIWKMRQLRHLYLGRGSQIHLPKLVYDDPVSSLQTLSEIDENVLFFDRRLLENLTKLKIYGNCRESMISTNLPVCLKSLWLDKGRNAIEGLVLSGYPHLYKLCLKGKLWRWPKSYEFPEQLAKLTLAYSQLQQDPMPVLEKLPNLLTLILLDDAYVGMKMVCSARGFCRLKDLQLVGIRQMELWEIEGGMPRLERLTLHACSKLNKIPDGLRWITTLKELDVNMPIIFHSRLDMHRVDWEKIKHIPSIITTKSKSKPRLDRSITGFYSMIEPTW